VDGPRAILLSENNFIYALKNAQGTEVAQSEQRLGYGLDNRGMVIRFSAGIWFPACSYHPDWYRGPPNHLYIGYSELFPRRQNSRSVKFITHLVPRL